MTTTLTPQALTGAQSRQKFRGSVPGSALTIDLTDVDGQGTAVDAIVVHALGGTIPTGTDGTVTLTQGTLAAPVASAPVLAQDGGGANWNLNAYYYKITALGPAGETLGSNEVTVTPINVDDSVTVSWSAVPGAVGYKIYRSEASGTYTTPALKTTITSGFTTTYLDQDGGAEGAGALPATNTSVVKSIPLLATYEALCRVFGPHGIVCKSGDGSTVTVTPTDAATACWVLFSY